MSPEEEQSLIARSRVGDLDAFAGLVRLHQRMIYSLTYRMSGSAADAKDLAQETFIRAHQNLASYRGTAKFSSWLYRIGLNLCLHWRKQERRRQRTLDEWAATGGDESGPDTRSERIQQALMSLSASQRAAVIATAFDGYSHAEAARMLGCLEATLSWRLFAARRRLRQLLLEGGKTP